MTRAQSANYKEYECEHLCVAVTTDDLTQEQERTKLTNTWHDSWHDSSTPPLGSHQVFLLRGRLGFCNNIIINLFIISDLKLIATTKLKRSHRIADSKINKSAYLKTLVSDGPNYAKWKHKQPTTILHRTNIQTLQWLGKFLSEWLVWWQIALQCQSEPKVQIQENQQREAEGGAEVASNHRDEYLLPGSWLYVSDQTFVKLW